MKKLFALYFTLTFATLSFAQSGKINGRVVSADGKAMEFVTVTLHHAKDTALVKGAITDATGNENCSYYQISHGRAPRAITCGWRGMGFTAWRFHGVYLAQPVRAQWGWKWIPPSPCARGPAYSRSGFYHC